MRMLTHGWHVIPVAAQIWCPWRWMESQSSCPFDMGKNTLQSGLFCVSVFMCKAMFVIVILMCVWGSTCKFEYIHSGICR